MWCSCKLSYRRKYRDNFKSLFILSILVSSLLGIYMQRGHAYICMFLYYLLVVCLLHLQKKAWFYILQTSLSHSLIFFSVNSYIYYINVTGFFSMCRRNLKNVNIFENNIERDFICIKRFRQRSSSYVIEKLCESTLTLSSRKKVLSISFCIGKRNELYTFIRLFSA